MTDHPDFDLQPARPSSDVPKSRLCLRCQTAFESEWSGERICRRCKSSASWRNGVPPAFGAAGRR